MIENNKILESKVNFSQKTHISGTQTKNAVPLKNIHQMAKQISK